MASKDKLTIKEIKAPDEFQTKMAKALEVLNLYRGWVGAGIILIVVAIVAGALLSRQSYKSRVERAKALDKAFAPVLAATLQTSKDTEAKEDSKEEQAAKLKAASAELDNFAATHANSPIGKAALLAKAAALWHAGDVKGAMQVWRSYLGTSSGEAIDFVLWEALGNAADAAGEREEAERAYSEMAKASSSVVRAQAYLHLGDMHHPAAQKDGDAKKAREWYEKGLSELGGDDALLGPAQLLLKKTLKNRVATL